MLKRTCDKEGRIHLCQRLPITHSSMAAIGTQASFATRSITREPQRPTQANPYTEALLLGVSGGITFGYFTFRYEGYDPQVNILTRNTFEPMETIFDRLAIPRESFQTTQPDKARKSLIEALEDGHVPIIWPDMFSLPYNGLAYDEMNWGPLPVVVYGYEPDLNQAYLADRSFVGLTVPADVLDAARARVKSDKHRMLIIEHPDASRLPGAVHEGIHDCIALMTEKPPRGSTKNFGLTGLQHWADMLEKTTKASWSREYATGRDLLSALTTAFYFAGPRIRQDHASGTRYLRRFPARSRCHSRQYRSGECRGALSYGG